MKFSSVKNINTEIAILLNNVFFAFVISSSLLAVIAFRSVKALVNISTIGVIIFKKLMTKLIILGKYTGISKVFLH